MGIHDPRASFNPELADELEKKRHKARTARIEKDGATSSRSVEAGITGGVTISDVDGLADALDDKAPIVHTHLMTDVTDLDAAMDLKADITGNVDITITDNTKGFVLKSPDGTLWRISVDNSGVLAAATV